MFRRPLVALAGVLVLVGAVAQPNPDIPSPNAPLQNPSLTMTVLRALDLAAPVTKETPQGLFIVRHGVVAKFDAVSMKPLGTLDLLSADDPWPKDGLFPNVQTEAMALLQRARRLQPAVLNTQGTDLLVVMGPYYFRLDMKTLALKVAVRYTDEEPILNLVSLVMNPEGETTDWTRAVMPPVVTVNGSTLCILHNGALTLLTIDGLADDGQHIGGAELPAAETDPLYPSAKKIPLPYGLSAEPTDGRPFLVMGQLKKTAGSAGGTPTWSVDDGKGLDLRLTGDPLAKLIGTPGADAVPVICYGVYHKAPAVTGGSGGASPSPAVKPTVSGALELQGYVVLGIATVK